MPTPADSRACARPGLLAETGWLADQLVDPRIRVVDARSAKEYAAAHIARAVHLDGFGNLPRAENGDMGSAAEFASLAGELGIEAPEARLSCRHSATTAGRPTRAPSTTGRNRADTVVKR